jgi:hypothetical protein
MDGAANAWFDRELAGCSLADERLNKRLRKLVAQIGSAMGQSIPLVCQDWANTDVVVDVLSSVEAIGVFQIVFMRDAAAGAMDRMVIRIERDAEDAALRDRLITGVQQAVSLRPQVEFVARGALYDQERSIKATRVVDLRPNVD